MIGALTSHLETALVSAGLPAGRVVVGAAALAQLKVLPRAVIHLKQTEEEMQRDGTLVAWWTKDGQRVYRRRLYRRQVEVMVQVDAETNEAAGALLMGALASAGAATVTGTTPGPWALEDQAQIVLLVKGTPVVAGIQAAPAGLIQAPTPGPFPLADGMTLELLVNESIVPEVITFTEAQFQNITQATLEEINAAINAQSVNFETVPSAPSLVLRTLRSGASAYLHLLETSTAFEALGMPAVESWGVGNVQDVSAVAVEELAALLEGGEPLVSVEAGPGGVLQISSLATGQTASILATEATYPAFGLDNDLHVGTDAAQAGSSFAKGDLVAFETTAPQMGVAAAVAALTALLESAYEFEFVHLVGEADSSMWTVADAKADEAAAAKRYVHVICEAPAPAPGRSTDEWVEARLVEAAAFSSSRVTVVAGPLAIADPLTGRTVTRSGGGVYSGRLSQVPVQRSPGRVADGALAAVLSLAPSDLTPAHVELLDAAGYVTFRTFLNTQSAKGVYVTLGRTMAGSTSDYKLVQNRRVMDKALWLVREKALPFLQDEADNGPDDSPGGLARFESVLQSALDGMQAAGEISDGRVIIPEGQNILSTQTIAAQVKIQPRGYMNYIDATVGFENPALA